MRNDVFRHRKQCSVDMLGTVLYNNVTGDYVDSRLQKHCHQHTYVMYTQRPGHENSRMAASGNLQQQKTIDIHKRTTIHYNQ